MIVNGNVRVNTRLWLVHPTTRLSIRGNLYNGVDPRLVSTIDVSSSGALLDLKGDYIQGHGLNNAGFVTSFNARVQLSGNSSQRIVFLIGGSVHLNNLHIRNQPSSYSISNGLNTYTIADAIADHPNSPKIWNNLFHDIEEGMTFRSGDGYRVMKGKHVLLLILIVIFGRKNIILTFYQLEMILRQLFLALIVFCFLIIAMMVRSFIYECVIFNKEWSFKTHWKSAVVLALSLSISYFVYLRVTGSIWL